MSFPSSDRYKELLDQAGKLSGRDIDKFKDLNIPVQKARTVDDPVIDNCGIIIECRTLYKQAMNPDDLDEEIRRVLYADDDYHMLYFGEVLFSTAMIRMKGGAMPTRPANLFTLTMVLPARESGSS